MVANLHPPAKSTRYRARICTSRTISIMRLLNSIVEVVVVTICLPFYAFAFPIMWWWNVRAAKQISLMSCPHCKSMMSKLTWRDLRTCGIRLRQPHGNHVIRERMPKLAVTCPTCNEKVCFDGQFRYTACDLSDAIARGSQPESSNMPSTGSPITKR